MAYDKSVSYSFKKNGIYYFERRVPADLERHYVSRKISFSLKTRSPRVASTRSLRAASQLEQWWYHLRMDAIDVPGKHLLRNASISCERLKAPNAVLTEERPTAALSDAVALYVRLKGNIRLAFRIPAKAGHPRRFSPGYPHGSASRAEPSRGRR